MTASPSHATEAEQAVLDAFSEQEDISEAVRLFQLRAGVRGLNESAAMVRGAMVRLGMVDISLYVSETGPLTSWKWAGSRLLRAADLVRLGQWAEETATAHRVAGNTGFLAEFVGEEFINAEELPSRHPFV